MPPHYPVQVIEIRVGSATDATAIARVRRESWHAAYAGIIAAPIIDRATETGGSAADPPPYRRTLVAEAGEGPAVIGYASYGPERTVATASPPPTAAAHGQPVQGQLPVAPPPAAPLSEARLPANAFPPAPHGMDPLTAEGRAGLVGELYALYIAPAWWSAGVGRELMSRALTGLRADGYQRVVLWVLTDNARARRFYEIAGFAPDGATNILTGLGGVQELRYARLFASA